MQDQLLAVAPKNLHIKRKNVDIVGFFFVRNNTAVSFNVKLFLINANAILYYTKAITTIKYILFT